MSETREIARTGLSRLFKTNEKLEIDGIYLEYDGQTRIRIARAGGANKQFVKLLDRKTKPVRRAIAIGSLDNERAEEILAEVYAETIILSWETKVGDTWTSGIVPGDAGMVGTGLLPTTKENYLKVLTNLPDLFKDIQLQAQMSALFRAEFDEASVGN